MKWLGLLWLLPHAAFASDAVELRQCVSQVEQYSQSLKARVPAPVLETDRRLFHMLAAVEFLGSNAELTIRSTSATLLANSLEGCRDFQQRFEARARIFQALALVFFLLVLTLTLRTILIIFSAPSEPGVPHGSLVSPSQDVVSGRRGDGHTD